MYCTPDCLRLGLRNVLTLIIFIWVGVMYYTDCLCLGWFNVLHPDC